jgi:hypothetical protein
MVMIKVSTLQSVTAGTIMRRFRCLHARRQSSLDRRAALHDPGADTDPRRPEYRGSSFPGRTTFWAINALRAGGAKFVHNKIM